MKMSRVMIVSVVVSLLFLTGIARSQVVYELEPTSTFQEGCVGPCSCPVMLSEEVTGTFVLVPAASDPLFTNYNLNEISWEVVDPQGTIAHQITGQGIYKLGGEVAVTHQLVLDLSIDGATPEHLDSGQVPGGAEFPLINIPVSRGTPCFNIWMNILAAPQNENSPIAVLENPILGQRVSGILPIYGWALDKKGIAKVELFIDDQLIGNTPYGGTRNDVKNSYPDYPDAGNSGFAMVWNYSTLSSGDHSIKVRVHNQDGLTRDLDALVTVKKFHGEIVEKMSPGTRWFNRSSVTVDGVTKKYQIEIEWSNQLQGFEIIDVIPK